MSVQAAKRSREWEIGSDHPIPKAEHKSTFQAEIPQRVSQAISQPSAPAQVQLVPILSNLIESPQSLAYKFVMMAHTIDTGNAEAADYILAAMIIEKREGMRAVLVVRLCQAYINTKNEDNIQRALTLCETWLKKDSLSIQQRKSLLELQKLGTSMLAGS